MLLDNVTAWVRKHYTWPVVVVLVLVSVFVPRTEVVVGVIVLTAVTVLGIDLFRRIGRGFRDGYRGRE